MRCVTRDIPGILWWMQLYACGFLFSKDRTRVILIRKNRPAWQAGKLNGLGGKLEPGETPYEAMRREFREEAGVDIPSWTECLTVTGEPSKADPRGWRGHFFRAFDDLEQCQAQTDERLEIHSVVGLPRDTIPNLQWMIPMMLDDEVFTTRSYRVEVK